ncbi:P-loop containing nucleoside triphosphate hydrolase protein [Dothidotthia symphoricarpi CBS 119687]|uniref:P-loop containing nucleoside triphosphate hydrolase protein n=1 Tax=Dothidotthia symphoricarpi CBS 119687 TaxID=1392245 RepID=A0A6A6A8U6_9PLEO|nr:P-loop containing nucleoside triphosphate hydrolase protein [Dothidotthia symphoricarpi CBS 119687]KAF2127504.1 P-loop containing nucleoside triphosphate hydrolase protein [Dothidotthia symphoricarpi CBS 119687]
MDSSESKDVQVDEEKRAVPQATVGVVIDVAADKKTKQSSKEKERQIQNSGSSDDSDADSESEDSDEDEKAKRKRKKKLAAKRAAAKAKQKAKAKSRKGKGKKHDSADEESSDMSSDQGSQSDLDKKKRRKRKDLRAKAKKKGKSYDSSSGDSNSDLPSSTTSSSSDSDNKKSKHKREKAKQKNKKSKISDDSSSSSSDSSTEEDAVETTTEAALLSAVEEDIETQVTNVNNLLNALKLKQATDAAAAAAAAVTTTLLPKAVKKNAHEFKRINQVWDTQIHDYKLVESTTEQKDEFDCVFTVRRRFDWDGKHRETQVDIKSKVLRNVLQEVLKECKSISLVEETPHIDPHTLFHYYDELEAHVKKTLKPKLKRAKRSKEKKQLKQQIAQCKLLLGYIDEDYAKTRKALKPMLKAGTITYDLCWALFKPNTIAFTPTYGNKDDARCFKVDFAYEYESWLSGAKSWYVNGRYLEYDGKVFGLGDHEVQIPAFKGHKKITSLAAYPLKYHRDPEGIKKRLIERGIKFVGLQGMNYRLQKGIAYQKVKNTIAKFNINGRVMVDPAIFRRINPNYPLSYIKQDELKQDDENDKDEDEDDDEDDCCCAGSDENEGSDTEKDKLRTVMWKDHKGKRHPIRVLQSTIDQETGANAASKLDDENDTSDKNHVFTEEELLIASPVVLGFAFSEKLWLEISLSGIEEINWNAEAFDSLVLPDRIKQNLKGLVSSHRFNAARTIDDVIQGKGKGLNVVLHGPPGVGKTLTGESIAEYLKCPLYSVSAGELGTNSRSLETDLNRIMDVTHSWGAILLLDEADVFLEARQPHDIHRNSLVSVFLRLTEYYQGILFLTTNRVETFDEAFQSRIHMGIRYENLQPKARKKIWQHHVGKVEAMSAKEEKSESVVKPFKEVDFDELSKRNMNGRQIKNTVKTSQSIALSEKEKFSMQHIKRVLEVAEAFEDDMRGGKGYRDAMRQYM